MPSVGEEEEGVEGGIRKEERVCGIFLLLLLFFPFFLFHLLIS